MSESSWPRRHRSVASSAVNDTFRPIPLLLRGMGCFVFSLFLFLYPQTTRADMLSVETGRGFHRSSHSEIFTLRYHWDAPDLLGLPGHYEALLSGWNGKRRASAVGLARSARWHWSDPWYLSGSAGIAYLDRTTDNLGTRYQMAFHLALGRTFGRWDLSAGYAHFSNGKLLFNWDGPNNGENFITIRLGHLF